MTDWPRAEHLARPDPSQSDDGSAGKLVVVGMGPGSPAHLTRAAREAIRAADAVYAAPLYQRFLRADGLLGGETDHAEEGDQPDSEPVVINSSRRDRRSQAAATFDRVRDGETVVHVSGGDPAVYGKSDLLVTLAETHADDEIPIEILPGVTAALGGAALLGAPLSNDFCTLSLSTARRDREAIDRKLEAVAGAGFVIALYNVNRSLGSALDVIETHRSGSVPVAVLEDVARGERGRSPTGETVTVTTLAALPEEIDVVTTGTLVVVGTEDSRVLRPANGGRPFLVTPRDGSAPLSDGGGEHGG
ncbi:SAM-dependent methyltransferase [Halorhabdus amylolytica]|uniref:SAM-dependent methyltransferase n=1 Tax=Halorhabdus amylolytica TaxID=2559573 RepID=UPI0010AB08DF|nr:SAM-dependent methyltransferase [Halorhabdus amylolytica]